ncbi:hypothetical protein F5Y13DRAFT_166896 [Hypoxylon sp. FL1857]|nr:hypothetical protein F5Y13DRAFT_166896 [Hypoxylon sp. FL1857]
MQTSVVSQTHAVLKNLNILENIFKILSEEVKASFQSFEKAVAKVCVSSQQIYAVVLEIQTSITSTPDITWNFFQDPLIVEDALGRKFPVPSEYDYSLLDAIIKHRFQDGPGAVQVAAGDYEIMDAGNRLHILSANSLLRPGCSITMAVLVKKPRSVVLAGGCCPMPRCRSSNTIAMPSGGRQYCNCAVWFDQSKKRPRSLTAVEISGRKRKRTHDDDLNIVPFKNVKLAMGFRSAFRTFSFGTWSTAPVAGSAKRLASYP